MPDPCDPRIVHIDPAGDNSKRKAEEAGAALLATFHPRMQLVPQAELDHNLPEAYLMTP